MKLVPLISGLCAATFLVAPALGFQVEELVAHWNFDETPGFLLADQTSYGYDASIGGGVGLGQAGAFPSTGNAAQFIGAQIVPGQLCVLFAGYQSLSGGNGMLFGDGLRCAGQQVQRLGIRMADVNGNANWGPALGSIGQWQAGDSRSFQVWYQDSGGSPCGAGFNASQALSISFGQ